MNYFILVNNQQQGPYTLQELRSRNISSATLVWAEGMDDWTPAWQVAELQPLFAGNAANNTANTPPPAPEQGTGQGIQGQQAQGTYGQQAQGAYGQQQYAEAAAEEALEHEREEERSHSHTLRNGCIGFIIVAVAIFIGLVSTCPTEEDHREAITKEINHFVQDAADNTAGDAWGMIGNMISQKLVGVVVDNLIEVDNYGVCSIGSIHYKGKTHHVSFGILGHVFTFDADDIQRALQKGGDASDIFNSPLNNPGNDDSSDSNADESDNGDSGNSGSAYENDSTDL